MVVKNATGGILGRKISSKITLASPAGEKFNFSFTPGTLNIFLIDLIWREIQYIVAAENSTSEKNC